MDAIDIFDIDKNPTGRTTRRPRDLSENEFRLVIHMCIFNSDGQLLIQKRRKSCAKWPGVWDVSLSGCAIAGEKGRDAAMREAKEELDLDTDLSNARPAFTVSFPGGFDEMFIIKQEVDLSKLTLQEEEVSDVRWASENEVLSLIEKGEFTPFISDYIRLLFKYKDTGDVYI